MSLQINSADGLLCVHLQLYLSQTNYFCIEITSYLRWWTLICLNNLNSISHLVALAFKMRHNTLNLLKKYKNKESLMGCVLIHLDAYHKCNLP